MHTQPPAGGGNLLDAIGDRMMYRNAYRNFGDHESMVFSHSVAPGAHSKATSAVRWYELRAKTVGGQFSLYQTGTFQNRKNNFWMASAVDRGDYVYAVYSGYAHKGQPMHAWLQQSRDKGITWTPPY